jgi:hypothetical protein
MGIRDVRSALKRRREERRRLLTRGERALAWSLAFAPSLLAVGGVALLVRGRGAGHGAGIVLLVVALFLMAVPISPFLQARVRRRKAQVARRP